MKLLIADDELVIRRGLESLDWKSIGIDEVVAVSNGLEAREQLLSLPVDLAMLDVKIPGMNGLELAEFIKEQEMDTAVVFLTGFSEFEYARTALRSGVYEYLLKPLRPREILSTMADVKRRLEEKRYQANSISRMFRRETGYSFTDVLVAIRLASAVNQLMNGELVNQVSSKNGFSDQRYFCVYLKRSNEYLSDVVALAMTILLLAFVITVKETKRLTDPVRQLLVSMSDFGKGNLATRVRLETKDEIGLIGKAYNQMADKIQNLLETVYAMEIAKKEAEIEFLKMQINPHFLYNTLDTLSWMGISSGNESVSDISVSLARLLRANVKNDSFITVEEEMCTVRDYLQIQHYRFGDKMLVKYEVDIEAGEWA